jgi:splicing factor 3A subunit 3
MSLSFPLIDEIRLLHAEIEDFYNDIIKGLTVNINSANKKQLLVQQLFINNQLISFTQQADKLNQLYKHANISIEVSNLQEKKLTQQIQSLHAHYLKNPISLIAPPAASATTAMDTAADTNTQETPTKTAAKPEEGLFAAVSLHFTEVEQGGKYLDLISFHLRYINLPLADRRTDYVTYMRNFTQFQLIDKLKPEFQAMAQDYKLYLADLLNYLVDFHKRLHPLVENEALIALIEEEFARQQSGKLIDAEITENPLFCKYCDKEFAKETVFNYHLQGKKHKKAYEEAQKSPGNGITIGKSNQSAYELGLLELKLAEFGKLLGGTIESTAQFIIRKQTRSYEELLADRKAELQAEIKANKPQNGENNAEANEEQLAPIYNPLNLPMGWDGKPIPVWLYKLQQLNQEFTCEICGNYRYRGPKEFSAHFNDSRHGYGLKCLGLANSKQFMWVTKIADAQALGDKIKLSEGKKEFHSDSEEEFEDNEGNIFNKKTYLELQRQGLL